MTETTTGDRQTQAAEISEHEQYRLLGDERRRTAANVLAEQSSSLTLSELATELAARETAAENVSQRTLEVRLHHVHLPLMDDVGVLDYDSEANHVDPRQPILDALNT